MNEVVFVEKPEVVYAAGILLSTSVSSAADASSQTHACKSQQIVYILSQTCSAEAKGDGRRLAELNVSLGEKMASFYYSGKAGGGYFGNSPLWDLLSAAGALSSAGSTWAVLRDPKKQCTSLRGAIANYLRD